EVGGAREADVAAGGMVGRLRGGDQRDRRAEVGYPLDPTRSGESDLLREVRLLGPGIRIPPERALVEVVLRCVNVGVEAVLRHPTQYPHARRVIPGRSVRALDDATPRERRAGLCR